MISGVILAAGAASRMGKIKQLLPLGPRPMLWHVAAAACQSQLAEVLVITGSAAELVAAAINDLPLRIIHNPDWQQGQSSSLHAGLLSLQPTTKAVLFLLADQPLVTPELINSLIDQWRCSGKTIICPSFEAKRGNPVLFDLAAWRNDLEQLDGDQGARRILAAHPEAIGYLPVATDEIFLDVDTAADYAKMQQRFGTSVEEV
jgi:molybdenum cofactor cytidylyltransferase